MSERTFSEVLDEYLNLRERLLCLSASNFSTHSQHCDAREAMDRKGPRLRRELDSYAAEEKRALVEALEDFERYDLLWLPEDITDENYDEAHALCALRDKMRGALAKARDGQGGEGEPE